MEEQMLKIKDVDRIFYKEQLRDFLPEKMIDIHTHVYQKQFLANQKDTVNVSWPSLVAAESPVEELLETYHLLFPGKTVTPLIFSSLLNRNDDFQGGNQYIRDCAKQYHLPSLYFSRPGEPASVIEKKMTSENFLGVKVYLSLAPENIPVGDITIFDFLPHHHLEVLNRLRGIVMLHIPGNGRLKDPVNLRQMMIIEKDYPQVKLIIAHVGRAYCKGDTGNAFETLSSTRHMMFDISANTNEYVFSKLIEAVGPDRILFGSDLPVTRMRMRRICEGNRYINLVPPGLYGDISNDPNMRETSPEEGKKLSFFLYEEIAAFQRAALKMRLNKKDIENVFYNNALRIL